MNTQSINEPQVTGYLLLFRNSNTDWTEGLPESQIRQAMDKVGAWLEKLSASGKMVAAQPLMEESVLVSGKGGQIVIDGPFAEAKEVIGGYVLLSVDSKEEAVEIAKSNPMLEYGHVTEVRPTSNVCPHTARALSQLAAAAA